MRRLALRALLAAVALLPVAQSRSALGETSAMLADASASAKDFEVRMLDGGFARARDGRLYPGFRLVFRYRGTKKTFHHNITVSLGEAGAPRLSSWKTFVSLKPGQALQRRYGRESLARWDRLDQAPKLWVRVGFKGWPAVSLPLPQAELPFGQGGEGDSVEKGLNAGKLKLQGTALKSTPQTQGIDR